MRKLFVGFQAQGIILVFVPIGVRLLHIFQMAPKFCGAILLSHWPEVDRDYTDLGTDVRTETLLYILDCVCGFYGREYCRHDLILQIRE